MKGSSIRLVKLKGSKFKRSSSKCVLIFQAVFLHDLFIEFFLVFFHLCIHVWVKYDVCIYSHLKMIVHEGKTVFESHRRISISENVCRMLRGISSRMYISLVKVVWEFPSKRCIKRFDKPIRQVQVCVYNIITLHINISLSTQMGKIICHVIEPVTALYSVIYVLYILIFSVHTSYPYSQQMLESFSPNQRKITPPACILFLRSFR